MRKLYQLLRPNDGDEGNPVTQAELHNRVAKAGTANKRESAVLLNSSIFSSAATNRPTAGETEARFFSR